jgi:uncharacterized protein YjiS (DUF1127 family)
MNRVFPFVVHKNRHAAIRILKAIGRALKVFVDGTSKAHKMHRDYETLSAMSNLELEDMGISRSDIHAVVTGTYCGARPAQFNAPFSAVSSGMVYRAAWSPNGVKAVGDQCAVIRRSSERGLSAGDPHDSATRLQDRCP